MSTEEDDLSELDRVTWRTAISQRVERFSSLLGDQAVFERYFGESYVTQLSAKTDRLFRWILFFGALYTILMVSLYLSQDSEKTEFEIFGYGFKNLAFHKEFLLLLASAISPISSLLGAYHRYLVAIRGACLQKLVPDPIARDYYAQLHVDSYFDALVKSASTGLTKSHGVVVFLFAAFGFTLVVLVLGLLAGSFVLQMNVIYDVATNPASSKYVNTFVVAFSLTAIILSWLIALMQLPLPEVDLSFYAKLDEVKKKDPKRHRALLRRMAAINARKERVWSVALSMLFFVVCYSAVSIWQPGVAVSLDAHLAKALVGAFMTAALSTAVVTWSKKTLYKRFFLKHPAESPQQLAAFVRLGKWLSALRVLTPFCTSIAFAVLWLHT